MASAMGLMPVTVGAVPSVLKFQVVASAMPAKAFALASTMAVESIRTWYPVPGERSLAGSMVTVVIPKVSSGAEVTS